MAALRLLPRVFAHVASDSIGDGKHESLRTCRVLTGSGSLVLASGKAGAANQSAKCWLARDRLLGRLFDLHCVDLPLLASPHWLAQGPFKADSLTHQESYSKRFFPSRNTSSSRFGTVLLYGWEIFHQAMREI